MAQTFKFAARLVRLRAPFMAAMIFAFAGCDTSEPLSPESSTLTGAENTTLADAENTTLADAENTTLAEVQGAPAELSFASASFAGGIPIGHAGQPVSAFGSYFNGAKMTISPGELVNYLRGIKARGGKVVLMLAGTDHYYKDSRGFNLTKWKARIDRFKGVNFSSYINDGTIIGHFLVDEPNDSHNWNGKTISPAVVDEMARYSKQRWSNMRTIVRVEPSYFRSRRPQYIDAAWAQYVTRKGNASDYIRRNVSDAQHAGMALVVGLNISKGGPNQRRMTPTEVKNFGSALLSSSYPCAFISWQYDSYVASTTMRDAMRMLRGKAQSRASKTCRG
jgi:hypothetical protein